MSKHLHAIKPEQFETEVQECPKAVIVIYWDSQAVDHRYRKEELSQLAEAYVDSVKVLVVDIADPDHIAWVGRQPYVDLDAMPCLQIYKTTEERTGLAVPGSISAQNFKVGLKAMFHCASRP